MSEPGTESVRQTRRPSTGRSRPAKAGRLPISEATSDRAGAGSPFGDDLTFPLPVHQLSYEHSDRG